MTSPQQSTRPRLQSSSDAWWSPDRLEEITREVKDHLPVHRVFTNPRSRAKTRPMRDIGDNISNTGSSCLALLLREIGAIHTRSNVQEPSTVFGLLPFFSLFFPFFLFFFLSLSLSDFSPSVFCFCFLCLFLCFFN